MEGESGDAAKTGAILCLAGSEGFVAPANQVQDLPGPRGKPLIGNFHQVDPMRMHVTLEQWREAYGPMYRFQLGTTTVVGVADHGLIHEILRHRPDGFSRPARLTSLMSDEFPGLVAAEGEVWRRQRKLVMRALAPEAVKRYFPIITAVTRRLELRWKDAVAHGRPIDVVRDLKCYSIDVTTWLSLGLDVDTLSHDDNPFQRDVELWFESVGRQLVPSRHDVKKFSEAGLADAMKRLLHTVETMIAGARASLKDSPALKDRPGSILESFVVARDEPGSEFTDDDVHANLTSMLFVGEDTTANALAWLLHYLAIDPRAKAQARAEADRHLGEASMVQAFGQLDELEYLEAATLEALRLKPVSPIQAMRANVPMNLAGLDIPAGQLLFILLRSPGLAESNFEQPMAFLPERWLSRGGDRPEASGRKVFSFGGGARTCPGRYLAMVEIKMVAAMLLRNFDLKLEMAPEEVGEYFTFVLKPETLHMGLSART